MLTNDICQGPLIETQRVAILGGAPDSRGRHLGAYVEMRSIRSRAGIHYNVEIGTLRWGHTGTWGRSGFAATQALFVSEIARAQAAVTA